MLNKKYSLNKKMDPVLINRMIEYDWPGNIRELRNAIEQAFVTSPSQLINQINLGPYQNKQIITNAESSLQSSISYKDAFKGFEYKLIKEAIGQYGSTRKAAAALGVSQATIWRKATQYGIELSNN